MILKELYKDKIEGGTPLIAIGSGSLNLREALKERGIEYVYKLFDNNWQNVTKAYSNNIFYLFALRYEDFIHFNMMGSLPEGWEICNGEFDWDEYDYMTNTYNMEGWLKLIRNGNLNLDNNTHFARRPRAISKSKTKVLMEQAKFITKKRELMNEQAKSLTPEGATFMGQGGSFDPPTDEDELEFKVVAQTLIDVINIDKIDWLSRQGGFDYEHCYYYSRPKPSEDEVLEIPEVKWENTVLRKQLTNIFHEIVDKVYEAGQTRPIL